MSSRTSYVKEVNVDDLNPYEGDRVLLLTENEDTRWRKLEFDPTITSGGTLALTLQDNKIVLTSIAGFQNPMEIDTNLQKFNLNNPGETRFEYELKDPNGLSFTQRASKGSLWIETSTEFINDPIFSIKTNGIGTLEWAGTSDITLNNDEFKNTAKTTSDINGNAFTVWTQNTAGNAVLVSQFDPNIDQWSTPFELDPPSNSGCAITSNEVGQAIAIWTREASDIIAVSFYDPNTLMWSTPEEISEIGSRDPQISMNDAGQAVAIWLTDGNNQLSGSVYDGTSWSDQEDISANGNEVSFFQVEVDDLGNAIVTYEFSVSGFGSEEIQAARYDVNTSSWITPIILSEASQMSTESNLSLDKASGNAMCVWQKNVAAGTDVPQFSSYDAGTQSWTSAVNIIPEVTNESSINLLVSLLADGTAIATWLFLDINNNPFIHAATYNGTIWGAPLQLFAYSGAGAIPNAFALTSNSHGQTITTWGDFDNSLQSAFYDPNISSWLLMNVFGPLPAGHSIQDIDLVVSDQQALYTWIDFDSSQSPSLTQVKSEIGEIEGFLFSASREKISFSFNRVQEVGDPVSNKDAANKEYVDTTFAALMKKVEKLEKSLKKPSPAKKATSKGKK